MEKETLCAYWLCCFQEIGNKKKRNLINFFGSPLEVFRAFDKKVISPVIQNDMPARDGVQAEKSGLFLREGFAEYLQKHIPGLQEKDITLLTANHDMEFIRRQYELMENRGISFVYQEEGHWPARLKNIDDAPLGLFFKGRLPEENVPAVAVVGARAASREGQIIARRFGRELAENGIQVISGMAKGVDIAAQRGALEAGCGTTWAVLGNGVDICYPRQNIEEFMLIQQRGGLLSEYPPGVSSLPWHFPMRNRIISGISDGVLVVEARAGSGSLITAETALDQGKEIFVVPGNILDGRYEGGNELLKSGAFPVTKVQDILDGLGLFDRDNMAGQKKKNEVMLETTEKMVYANLSFEPVHISVLVEKTSLKLQEVMEILLGLQLKKLVSAVGNSYFVIKSQ